MVNPFWRLFSFFRAGRYAPGGAAGDEGLARLAQILDCTPGELAALRLGPRYHYRPFAVAKRDGRERRILAPSPALKTLQRRLLRRYLARLPVHPAATAFRSGGSTVEHARRHAGQAYVATVDLADFFESTRVERVRAFFLRHGWRGPALSVLLRLCTYRGALPQGAPTSPCLSNLVNDELDAALAACAARAGARYSRYGDDLAFSWSTPRDGAVLRDAVLAALAAAGYAVQPRKAWRVQPRGATPVVTGLVLEPDGRVRAPAALRLRAWLLRRRLRRQPDPARAAQLRGYEGYLEMVEGPRR